jgi:hypothetical protein
VFAPLVLHKVQQLLHILAVPKFNLHVSSGNNENPLAQFCSFEVIYNLIQIREQNSRSLQQFQMEGHKRLKLY